MKHVTLNEDNSSNSSKAERVARVIFAHAAVISMQRDVGALLQLNADLARDLLDAERCSVWLFDEATNELWTKVAHGVSDIRIPMHSGLAGTCFQTNQPIIVNDLASDARFYRGVDATSGYESRSALCVPLQEGGAAIGVLQVLNKPGGFSTEDTEILRLMSLYSASAIQAERLRQVKEATRLLQRELDVAAAVQQRLLPQKAFSSDFFEYAGFCRPANTVGGDFFDVLPLEDGSVAFTLGDVAGKGFPAAVLMASIHTLLRHLLLNSSADLSDVLTKLNRTVYLSSSAERYATLFCGVVNANGRALRFVNAGHVPPLIVRAGAEHIAQEARGDVPLGLLVSTRYEEYVLDINPGDLLVCMSDGIVEAESVDGSCIDPDLVKAAVLETRNQPVAQILAAVIATVDAFAGQQHQYDDMTLFALRIPREAQAQPTHGLNSQEAPPVQPELR